MKQIKKLLSVLLVLAMVLVYLPPVTVHAEGDTKDITITFDDKAKRTEYSTTKQVWEENGITVTNNKASSTNNVADYAEPARFYKNSELVVVCGGAITQIVFNANNSTYATAIKNSISSGATVTVSSNVVTVVLDTPATSFAFTLSGGQARIDSMVVTTLVGGSSEGGETPSDPVMYDVSFDLNGAEGTAPNAIQVEDGKAYGDKLPSAPEREGYTFEGWALEDDTVVTAETIVSSSHTLYAKWTPKEVTPESTPGETEPDPTPDVPEGTPTELTITFDDKAKRTEYSTTKQVWKENGITVTNSKDASTTNVGDYANPVRFYKSSTIKIECGSMTQMVIVGGGTGNSEYVTAIGNTLTNAGYTYVLDGATYTITFTEPTDSVTLIASAQIRFASITVTALIVGGSENIDVSFDLNYEGATDIPETITRGAGATYGELIVPTRAGYEFGGWYKVPGCTGTAVTESDVVVETHTLYAKWIATISFDLNYDGAVDVPQAVLVDAGKFYGALPTATREGYIFGGWFTDALCTGNAVTATTVVTAPHTLYAKWTEEKDVEQIAVDFTDKSMREGYSEDQQIWKNGGLVFTNNKAESSTDVGDHDEAVRLYKGSEITIACAGMLQIAIISDSATEYKNNLAASLNEAGITYTVSNDVYTIILAEPVDSITVKMSGGQVRLKSITVTALEPAPEVFDVSFDLNYDDAPDPEVKQITEGEAYGELPTPERTGYTFDGWYLGAECTGEAVTDQTVVAAAHILYAKWTYIPPAAPEVKEWSMTLEDEVIVNFKVDISPATKEDPNAYVEVKIGSNTIKTPVALVDDVISVPAFATQMTDEITLCVVDGNGGRSEEVKCTIRDYCNTILGDQKYANYHQLVKEMLNYGSAAQIAFNRNTENLAGAGIEGAGQTNVPTTSTSAAALSDQSDVLDCTGASLVYRDKIAVRYYFTGSLTDCTFSVTGANGNAVVNAEGGYVEVADILPQNLDQEVTLSATDGDGKILTIKYCPMNYIVRMSQKGTDATKNLVKALYNYYLAASEFVKKAA